MTVPPQNLQTANGFGQASYQIVSSLQRLGHEVRLFDKTAPVEFAFCQPEYWQWSNKSAYHIGYVPWESTHVPEKWKYYMRGADEIWTTSPLVASWFKDAGIEAKVYQHGVDSSVWTRKKRVRNGPVKLLHIGEPAVRKGGPLVLQTFTDRFAFDDDATLTIKSNGPTDLRSDLPNVTIIEDKYSEEELVKLVHDHDVLVYPSWGEGFGLIPLQAMSTGMPTIITEGWAPYEYLVNQSLLVSTDWSPSPWPKVHPGKMLRPNPIDLGWALEDAVEDFDHYAEFCDMLAVDVHEDYNWDKLTAEAFAPVVSRFDS